MQQFLIDNSAEQNARDLLERMGIEDAQKFTAGDLVELANFISDYLWIKEKIKAGKISVNENYPGLSNPELQKIDNYLNEILERF